LKISIFPEHEFACSPVSERLIFLGLALAVLAVFGRLAAFDFVFFDDHVYVIEKAQVLAGLTPASVWWALTATDAGFWHPLTWISLMIDHELWGLNPGGYHLTNVLLHLAATLLLFAGLRRLTGAVVQSAFVAALFALHPLHVESVAWIAERKDVLSGCFWMLTLLLYARYVERPGWGRYALVLLSFLLGLAAKPMVVTLPVILLLLDIWPCRRLVGFNGESVERGKILMVIGEKLPMLILGFAVGMVTMAAETQVGALKTFVEFPLFSRLTNAVVAYVFYLYKTVWPVGLTVHYLHPGGWPAGTVVVSLAILAALTFLAVNRCKSQPFYLVGWFWYLISLLPVSGLIQIGSHAFADRYTYIPLNGVFIAVVWGVGEWATERGKKALVTEDKQAEVPGRPGSAAPYRTGGGEEGRSTVICRQDANAFDDVTKSGDIEAEPSPRPEAEAESENAPGLQDVDLQKAVRPPSALPAATWEAMGVGHCVAASVKPGNWEVSPSAVATLGTALIFVFALISFFQVGYWRNAENLFRHAVAVDEKNWLANNNLGAALSRQERYGEAYHYFDQALRYRSDYHEVFFNMGVALAGQGRFREALPYYERVIAHNPLFVQGYNNMGIAWARLGNHERAIAAFREAVRIHPGYRQAIENLRIAEEEDSAKKKR